MDAIEIIEYEGYNIKIIPDDSPFSPREWDNVGTMVCWHRNYNLGDEHSYSYPHSFVVDMWHEYGTDEEIREIVVSEFSKLPLSDCKYLLYRYSGDLRCMFVDEGFEHPSKHFPDAVEVIPVFMYEHSGIILNTSGFSCPWDSGHVGYIYTTHKFIKKAWGELTEENIEKARKCMIGEVATYSDYVSGNVYGFVVETEEGDFIDSCWGFYGDDYDHMVGEAKSVIDYEIQEQDNYLSML